MEERRSPWLVASALLIAAGLIGAATTYLWWLPCRGQMLLGTHWWGWYDGAGFGAACLERMNEGSAFPLPGPTTTSILALSALTVVLAGVSWLVPVLTQPFGARTRTVLLFPGVGVLTLAMMGVWTGRGEIDQGAGLLVASGVSVALVAAWVGLLQLYGRERPFELVRWTLALLALNVFSLVGVFTDYGLMGLWSEADWDSPPGSGYPAAAWLMICGSAIGVLTLVDAGRSNRAGEAPTVAQPRPRRNRSSRYVP